MASGLSLHKRILTTMIHTFFSFCISSEIKLLKVIIKNEIILTFYCVTKWHSILDALTLLAFFELYVRSIYHCA